jgi:hypothetical protein
LRKRKGGQAAFAIVPLGQRLCSPGANTLRACAPEPFDLGLKEFKQVRGWDYLPEIIPRSAHVSKVSTKSQLVFSSTEDFIVFAHHGLLFALNSNAMMI